MQNNTCQLLIEITEYDQYSYPYQKLLYDFLITHPDPCKWSHLNLNYTFKYHHHQQQIFDAHESGMCRIYYTQISHTNDIIIIDGFDQTIVSISMETIMKRCVSPYQFDVPIVHTLLCELGVITSGDLLFMDIYQTSQTSKSRILN